MGRSDTLDQCHEGQGELQIAWAQEEAQVEETDKGRKEIRWLRWLAGQAILA